MGKMTFRPADCLVDDVWGKIGTDERDRMEADLKKEVDDYFMREAIKDEKSDSRFDRLLDLERFIPVMSEEEVRRLADGRTDFGRETIARWERMASDRKERTDAIFREAYKRQEELCRQRTVN